jgi:polyferredoxin
MNARQWVRAARRTVAAVFGVGLVLAFVDFRTWFPAWLSEPLAAVQLIPAWRAGGMALLIVAAILLVTALVGRVYCSTLCPLGFLQDVIARVAGWVRLRPRMLRFARPWNRVRYAVLGAVGVATLAGWGGLVWAVMDPYSQFGRVMSVVARPLVVLGNNALAGPAQAMGWTGWVRVEPVWAPPGVLLLPLLLLLALVVMAALRGRLFCNTLCPVGALLGLFAGRARWRMAIRADACGKCAECLRACKAQCIDLKAGHVDHSRCVMCLDCVGACERGAMHLEPAAERAAAREPLVPAGMGGVVSARREFLVTVASGLAAATGSSQLAARPEREERENDEREDDDDHDHEENREHGEHKRHEGRERRRQGGPDERCEECGDCDDGMRTGLARVAVPPGAGDAARFLGACTACQLCVSACTTGVLQASFLEHGIEGWMKPRLDFSRGYCNYDCTRCGDVCPADAIRELRPAEKHVTRIGVVRFRKCDCIVHEQGTDCAACSEHCPTTAITTVPFRNGLFLPKVNADLCIGCGACEHVCPAEEKAMRVRPLAVHGRAKVRVAQAPARLEQSDGFAF